MATTSGMVKETASALATGTNRISANKRSRKNKCSDSKGTGRTKEGAVKEGLLYNGNR